MIQLTLTLKMTTAQVVETSATVSNDSPIQHYVHPDDQTEPTFETTPGFKPFTHIKKLHTRVLHRRPNICSHSVFSCFTGTEESYRPINNYRVIEFLSIVPYIDIVFPFLWPFVKQGALILRGDLNPLWGFFSFLQFVFFYAKQLAQFNSNNAYLFICCQNLDFFKTRLSCRT